MNHRHLNHRHPDHSDELPRLNRISGQIEGVKKMITDSRHCPEILTQLRAVRAAIRTIEANILESHLQSCIADVMTHGNKKEQEQKIAQLKEMFKRFDE